MPASSIVIHQPLGPRKGFLGAALETLEPLLRRGGVALLLVMPAIAWAGSAPIVHVKDGASVLSAAQVAELEPRLAALAPHAQMVVETRILADPSAIDGLGKPAYDELVARVGHSRVVYVLAGYAPDKTHVTLWTAAGPDVWSGLQKSEIEKLESNAQNVLTPENLVAFAKMLASRLSEAQKLYSGPEVRYTLLESVIDRLPTAAGMLLGLAAAIMIWRRGGLCPHCGGPLKTRVSISLISGPRGRIAKKTYRCFRCGYSRRQSLWPAVMVPAPRDERSRERHRAVGE